jgi:hypothetical protein
LSKQVVFIYELYDPVRNAVFYVGLSCDPHERFVGHLAESALNPADEGLRLKQRWISEVRALYGSLPQVRVLERVVGGHRSARSRETFWIVMRLAHGCPLTNKEFSCIRQWGLTAAKAERLARENLVWWAKQHCSRSGLASVILELWLADYGEYSPDV